MLFEGVTAIRLLHGSVACESERWQGPISQCTHLPVIEMAAKIPISVNKAKWDKAFAEIGMHRAALVFRHRQAQAHAVVNE